MVGSSAGGRSFGSGPSVSSLRLSVIIPVLNDHRALHKLLTFLDDYDVEIIVVDGGSNPPLDALIDEFDAKLVLSDKGRARQMNKGADYAEGGVYLFLHADSQPPQFFDSIIKGAIRTRAFDWGFFEVRLSGKNIMFRIIEWFMNGRANMTTIATGDMGLFVSADRFEEVKGFADIAIMEDIEFCRRMDRRPFVTPHKLITSSRRWEEKGIFKTILFMWSMRLRYFFGEHPDSLVKRYYG